MGQPSLEALDSTRSRSGISSCAGTSGGADCRTGMWTTSRSMRSCATRRPWWMPLGLERFALLGISQGGAVAAAYAARHPERVSHLVLCGAYTRGWRHRADAREIEERTALLNLTRLGWGQNNPAFRQMFTTRFIPDAGPAEMEWFNDLQRVSTSPENAARLMDTFSRLDVRPCSRTSRRPRSSFIPARRRRAVRRGATAGGRHPGIDVRPAPQPQSSRARRRARVDDLPARAWRVSRLARQRSATRSPRVATTTSDVIPPGAPAGTIPQRVAR